MPEEKPRIVITYCRQCNWLLRAAWMAQELLSTFAEDLGEVALLPSTGGAFRIEVDGVLIWDRKDDGGFPDVRTLKQRVRDRLDPARDLGHVDGGVARMERQRGPGTGAGAEPAVAPAEPQFPDCASLHPGYGSEVAAAPSKDIGALLAIMARLRTAVSGCPWDLAQDFSTIAPYTIEEAYEVADAIERGDLDDLKDELGDLLLQVVFHAQMAAEAGRFGFGDVVEAITAKMIRRHPHVFGDRDAADAAAVKRRWEEIKAEEKAERAARRPSEGASSGLLDEVPVALPALTRALKLQRRAGTVGFDWNDPHAVIAKIREEVDEFESELSGAAGDRDRLEGELGDILFAVANLARHLAIEPETALRRSNTKFVRRFRHIETELERRGRVPAEASLAEMEALWEDAKRGEDAA